MENRGLLFIPDISGFTRFINETEIDHSRLIIQELLETLINANELGLELSEIEGDAILFYKFGEVPPMQELFKQVEKMFCNFHQSIIAYDQRRFCQCVACRSAINLSLKVITHYGEFAGYNVKNFNKLIGKDVIVAHQLLKNDIEQHEYWLVTKNLLTDSPPERLTKWMQWTSSAKHTEAGDIPFHYTQLSRLKDQVTPNTFPQLDFSRKHKMISLSREYETDIITLFHASGDFNYRSRWQEGVKSVTELNHFLPRIGMRCRCVLESGEVVLYASGYTYTPDRIEFSETEEVTKNTTYYTLERLGSRRTKLTLDYYLEKNIAGQIIFKLTKKNELENTIKKSLSNLTELVKEIRLAPQTL